MTEWLHFHFSLLCIGEGNGNPLHCSCLENPRDRGAWWAAVYGVSQSRTRLKQLSSSSRQNPSKGKVRSHRVCQPRVDPLEGRAELARGTHQAVYWQRRKVFPVLAWYDLIFAAAQQLALFSFHPPSEWNLLLQFSCSYAAIVYWV